MKNSKTPITHGIKISAYLILSFLFFAALGKHINPIFSLFNGAIMAFGMLTFLKRYKKREGENFNYQKGFVASLFTGLNATLFFTIFFGLYAGLIEPNYIATMLGHWSSYYHTPQALIIFIVFAMGVVTTLILSLAYMQYFKDSWNTHAKTNKSMEIQLTNPHTN